MPKFEINVSSKVRKKYENTLKKIYKHKFEPIDLFVDFLRNEDAMDFYCRPRDDDPMYYLISKKRGGSFVIITTNEGEDILIFKGSEDKAIEAIEKSHKKTLEEAQKLYG